MLRSSFINNHPQLEATKMPFTVGMDKQLQITQYPAVKRIKLSIFKSHPCNMDGSQVHSVSERSQILKLAYYVTVFM